MTTPKPDPQIGLEDEYLSDEALVVSLIEQLTILEENRAGHIAFDRSNRKIQKMMPWDGNEHHYRVGIHVIEMTKKVGGREVEYTTQPGYKVNINPKVKDPAAAE